MHDENSYITLTYNDDNLPYHGGLVKKDYQDFIKRLRHHVGKIRYYMCGEYGNPLEGWRPHYHAIIFGFNPPDLKFYKNNKNGDKLYTSEFLEHVWGKGFTITGGVTFESAAYVARYVMKKQTGENAAGHYQKINEATGEVFDIIPEYNDMSRNPGIAKPYYEMYGHEVRKHDSVVVRGYESRPPRYYDNLHDEETLERIKGRREKNRRLHASDNTLVRLRTRETVKRAQTNQLKRSEI